MYPSEIISVVKIGDQVSNTIRRSSRGEVQTVRVRVEQSSEIQKLDTMSASAGSKFTLRGGLTTSAVDVNVTSSKLQDILMSIFLHIQSQLQVGLDRWHLLI